MAISTAVYNTIREIVDERIHIYRERLDEIKVEREEFDGLIRSVNVLVQAQVRTEKRIEELAQAQIKTEKRVEEFVQAQAKTEERVTRLEAAVERLAEAQAKTEERLTRVEVAVERLAEAQAKTEHTLEQLCKNVGRLSDTIGFGLEDIAKIVVPGYLERHTGLRMIEEFERNFIEVDGKEIEVDLCAEYSRDGKTVLVIGESKSKIYEGEVKKFLFNIVEPVRKKEKDMEIYPFMFGYVLHPSAKRLADKEGIQLIASYQR